MKTATIPYCFPRDSRDGPWGAGSIGLTWYVINKYTGTAKKIGPVNSRGTNYFDRAIIEAAKRNSK